MLRDRDREKDEVTERVTRTERETERGGRERDGKGERWGQKN